MFIGWIRKRNFEDDLVKLSESVPIDKNLVLNTFQENPNLCFGAYRGEELVAMVGAYLFDNSILINIFYYMEDVEDDIKKRLLQILLKNINDNKRSILFMANSAEELIFKEFGFKHYAPFEKVLYSGAAVAFNFSNATAKSINNENFLPIVKELDFKIFNENRFEYISKTLIKQSSMVLSTQYGYQHSYALNRAIIRISPWIMVNEAYTDAEKLIRGVIHHRGFKKIITFIPKEIKEITNLYRSYKFESIGDYSLIYLNNKPNISLESIYGF